MTLPANSGTCIYNSLPREERDCGNASPFTARIGQKYAAGSFRYRLGFSSTIAKILIVLVLSENALSANPRTRLLTYTVDGEKPAKTSGFDHVCAGWWA